MKSFIDYIEVSCEKLGDSHMAYLYKKHILDEMTERANEVTHAGLRDETVLADLMADEYPDLVGGFSAFVKEQKKRKRAKLMRIASVVGSFLVFVTSLILFFVVGNNTTFTYYGYDDNVLGMHTVSGYRWSWLILLGAIFGIIIFYTSLGIKKICHMRRVFHPIARGLIVMCVMLTTVFAFLCALMLTTRPLETKMWPIVIGGVILALIADTFFAFSTKQKFRTITTMIYMPIIAILLFIILEAYGIVADGMGWLFVLIGLAVVVVYILCIAAGNAKYFMYRQEDDE